ncbi:MAG TPA: hypothetical protein VNU26_18850 [Mycobacteriales bacterium]|nr:hypothetical protein [Mycobacteriales bacterium]
MTAYQELVGEGRPGPQFAALLYRTVRAVAWARNFPPPEGHSAWDDDAVFETAHDFLDGERGRKRLVDLALRSTSQDSLAAQLNGAVVNHLRDAARATDMGALVRRIRELLGDDDRFAPAAGGRWALSDGPSDPSAAGPGALAAAAAGETDVDVPAWDSARRRAPLADRPSLLRLVARVLRAADGSLTTADVARAVAARLDPTRVPFVTELDVLERVPDPSTSGRPEAVVARIRAQEIFAEMSDRERVLLASWDRPLRDLGELLDVRHSQAAVIKQRLAAWLRQSVLEDGAEDADEVVMDVRSLCAAWMADRTPGAGTTSS